MNSHLYIVDGIARDLAAEQPKVYHILGDDPFQGSPEWAECIRANEYIGFCWCDVKLSQFVALHTMHAEVEQKASIGKPVFERTSFGDIIATRLIFNE